MEHEESSGGDEVSPSDYLNMNEEAENIQPADVQQDIVDFIEDVGPSEISTATSKRNTRGPTLMPSGFYVITELSPEGQPLALKRALTPYSNSCDVIIKDDISINYRYWKTNDHSEIPWIVPQWLKNACWEKLK